MRLAPLLLVASAIIGADTPPVAPAPPPPPAAADPVFEVRPGRLGMVRYRHWQNDGVHTSDQRDFQAEIRFFAKNDAAVLGWRELTITEAVSDAGETLELGRNNGDREGRIDPDFRRNRDGDAPAFEVQLSFAWPQKPCNGLSKLSGKVTALVAAGVAKKAELKPFKDIVGKTLEISGIPGGEIAVDKAEQGQGVTVRYPATLQDKIIGIVFTDANGRELRVNGWGGGGEDTEVERTYHVKLPDDGAIVVSIMPETKAVVVPFQVAAMTMEAATGKGARERVKVEAKDATPDPAKKPDGNTLPVKPVGEKTQF